MSSNLPTHYIQQYGNTTALLAQQLVSKLESTVMSGSHVGDSASPVDQYGKLEAVDSTAIARFSAIVHQQAPLDRRWVLPTDWHIPQIIDKRDILRIITDPKAPEAKLAVAGLKRQTDRLILNAIAGTAQTGVRGATATTFPAGQTVGVSFGVALSKLGVLKMREAKRILEANDIMTELEEVTLVCSPTDHDALLADILVTSSDYNSDAYVLKEGRVIRFLGMNIITSNLLGTGTDDLAGTSRPCYVYCKSGMYLGKWADVTVDVRERADLISLPWQILTQMTAGATRLQETTAVRIWCR